MIEKKKEYHPTVGLTFLMIIFMGFLESDKFLIKIIFSFITIVFFVRILILKIFNRKYLLLNESIERIFYIIEMSTFILGTVGVVINRMNILNLAIYFNNWVFTIITIFPTYLMQFYQYKK
ncbi:MAG: hypothetical protein RR483_01655 [Clostridia bacterium]